MPSRLFTTLSVVALLGLSTVAYGDWIWYSKDNSVSKPEKRLPNGDCLELICKHGCVEDASNEYLGGCCPSNGASGGACTVDGKYVNTCCQSGVCEEGYCSETCPLNSSTEVTSWQIGETGCYCEPGYVVNSEGTGCEQGCQSYQDCASGEFCDMTGNITDCNERPTAGVCRKAKKKRIFDGYDFYTYDGETTLGKYKNTGGMDWWSAMDFCAAIGEPTVSYKDYCATEDIGSQSACYGYRGIGDCPAFNIGSNGNDYWLSDLLPSNNCYAFDLTFGADLCAGNGTDKTKDYDNDSPRYALCGNGPGKKCSTNDDCCDGYFCAYFIDGVYGSPKSTDCRTGPIEKGKCFKVSDYQEKAGEFVFSNERMDWYSANNFCSANKNNGSPMHMPSIESLQCYSDKYMKIEGNGSGEGGSCCKNEEAPCGDASWRKSNRSELFSIPIVHVANVIKTEQWYWTSSRYASDSCAVYDFGTNRGAYSYGYRNSHAYALCGEPEPSNCPEPLPSYNEGCTLDCGCLDQATTGLICQSNKCVCPENYTWDSETQKCVDATSSCRSDADCGCIPTPYPYMPYYCGCMNGFCQALGAGQLNFYWHQKDEQIDLYTINNSNEYAVGEHLPQLLNDLKKGKVFVGYSPKVRSSCHAEPLLNYFRKCPPSR